MNLAPVIRGITCPPSPSAAHGNCPASLAGCIVPSLDAPGGPHASGASPGPTVWRIIRSAQSYDKSLLQSLSRLDAARHIPFTDQVEYPLSWNRGMSTPGSARDMPSASVAQCGPSGDVCRARGCDACTQAHQPEG